MDPVSAFGLAVNILAIIELSAKVISNASEIWSYGETTTTRDRAAVAEHLDSHCQKLIEPPEKSNDDRIPRLPSEDDAALRLLAKEAQAIAQDIRQSLTRRQENRTVMKTLRDAVLIIWGEQKMKDKTKRLEAMRAQIQFGLILSIKSSIETASSTGLQKIDKSIEEIIETLQSGHGAIHSDMERRVADLNKEIESHFHQAAWLDSQRHHELLDAVSKARVQTVNTVSKDPVFITARILKKLWFPRINDRYEDILLAHTKTFEWIFSRDIQLQLSCTFVDWIESGTGVYWVSGRAGSGKSTLLKYMAGDPRTEMLLQTWASNQPLVIAKYWFWDQSSDILQKSVDGLFRGILHSLIQQDPSFAMLLFPDQFEQEQDWVEDFPTSNELKRAFDRLISLNSPPKHVALLIDGLDEYSASHKAQHDLALSLKRAARSKHMKIIASSRPEAAFKNAFMDCDKLYLHDMTSQDQTLFISDRLYEHQRTSYLVDLSGGKTAIDHLIRSAVERSEGIFLWLRLVVEALIKELDVCESIGDLQYILLQFPQGLETLFLHMMRRMLRENDRRGFECLWIMQQSLNLQYKQSPYHGQGRLTGQQDANHSFKLTVFCMDGAQMPFDAVLRTKVAPLSSVALKDTVTKVENRLRSWCAGLLELTLPSVDSPDDKLHEPGVAFIHRSVSEFLKLPSTISDLKEELFEASLDVNFLLMKGLLVKLKREAMLWGLRRTGRIWIFVELIMRLAQFTNDGRRHESRALLSELDRSMISLFEIRRKEPYYQLIYQTILFEPWTGAFPWALRKAPKGPGTPQDCVLRSAGFLSIAVENGLAEFALDNLDTPEIKSSSKATVRVALLNSACRPPPFSIAIPGTIRPAIIHRLLDLGAEPNQLCKDGLGKQTTPWKSMLKTVNDLEVMTVEGARQFAEILTAMIKHGADKRVRIRTKTLSKRDDTEYTGGMENESNSSTEAMISSLETFTVAQTTDQNDWKPPFESYHPESASLEDQIEGPVYSEEESLYAPSSVDSLSSVPSGDSHLLSRYWKENSLTVREIIDQSFITKPSVRKRTYDSELSGKFVPFEEIDSTWAITDKQWGREYGATYPANFVPPKLTTSEKESIQSMGLALLKLLDQKCSTRHADSEDVRSVSVQTADAEVVQTVSVKHPRLSKRQKFRTIKAELTARFRRNRK